MKLRQFLVAFKIKIIRYFESLQGRPNKERSLGFVSKKAKISRQSLRSWLKNKDILVAQFKKHDRKKIKSIVDRCECEVKNWVVEQRENGACLDGCAIKCKAIQLYNDILAILLWLPLLSLIGLY